MVNFWFPRIYQKLFSDLTWALKTKKTAKFNIGLGIILKNNITGDLKYYYVSTNSFLFQPAATISKMSDVKSILQKLYDLDLGEYYCMVRPTSSWSVVGFTNVFFKLYHISVPLG